MKRKIVVSAGGTATAWHIVTKIKQNFVNEFEVTVVDMNPQHLVPSSSLCDKFIQVPPINHENYYSVMLELFEMEKTDLFVPLIDFDLFLFGRDNPDLNRLGVCSTAPSKWTVDTCLNKTSAGRFLNSNGIAVPKSYEVCEVGEEKTYFIKPEVGFGSMGARIASGKEIAQMNTDNLIIQDICNKPEVTVEVYHHEGDLRTVCRERIEVKSGVCTKARIFHDVELQRIVERLSGLIDLPVASCIQFMKYREEWVVTDINLRLGAGTALSSCAGWELTSATLATWGQTKHSPLGFLQSFQGDRYVVRYYQELMM